jgi:dethiobiotin synthetase
MPVVVVARPGLGTINHTLLTVEALRARGLAVLGFVFSGQEEDDGRGAVGALNHQLIAEFGAVPFLGALPRLEEREMDAGSLARAAEEHLELAPLAQALAD